MKNTRLFLIIVVFGITIPEYMKAQETQQHILIEFQKLNQVVIGQAHNLHIHLTAQETIDSVIVDISLPRQVSVLNGDLQAFWLHMNAGAQRHIVLHLVFEDTIRGLFTVNVRSKRDSITKEDSEDLFLFGYGNIVEIMTPGEAADYSEREWQTSTADTTIATIPLSYEHRFIQLLPGENNEHRSLTFLPGIPFAMIDTTISADNMPGLPKESATSIQVTVSGRFRYKDYDGNRHAMANAKVKIYDDDAVVDDYLGSTTTDGQGYFVKTVSGSDSWPWNDEIEIYAKVCTENSEIVISTSWTGTSHKWHTATHSTSGGTLNLGWQLVASGNYGACSVFEWMNDAWNAGANAGYDVGSRVFTHFPNHYNETSFYAIGWWIFEGLNVSYLGDIFIDESDWHKWDYDNDISYHEFGHAFMHRMQDWWWPDNTGGYHEADDILNPSFAWTEGWATAYAQFVDTDGWYNDWLPIEYPYTWYPHGYENETRVAASVSDLFDSNQDGDDYIELPFSLLVEMLQDHNNDDLVEFWNNLKSTLSQSDKHYASRALIYNTIVVPLEPPPPPPPDPLSVTILGPWSLGYKESGTFTANVSGGSGTIIYQWYKKSDGSSTWYTLGTQETQTARMSFSGFTLEVVVTRGNENAEDTHHVEYEGDLPKLAVNIPQSYGISQNHPNPFNPVTTIVYELPEASDVTLVIYDLLGRAVMKWIVEQEQPGYKQVVWDGRNSNGQLIPGGIYIYRLIARSIESDKRFTRSRKMVMIR